MHSINEKMLFIEIFLLLISLPLDKRYFGQAQNEVCGCLCFDPLDCKSQTQIEMYGRMIFLCMLIWQTLEQKR